jgi:hypothetical protein
VDRLVKAGKIHLALDLGHLYLSASNIELLTEAKLETVLEVFHDEQFESKKLQTLWRLGGSSLPIPTFLSDFVSTHRSIRRTNRLFMAERKRATTDYPALGAQLVQR